MNHLDMFSGIGGFALAAKWAGIETIGFSEIDKFCCKVLQKHWPTVKNYGDIRNIDELPHADLMTGGFPCQPFSSAGKKKGKEDERYLWPQFYRAIKLSKPTWIIIENVKGAVDLALNTVCTDLESQNYEMQSFIIPACAANAPHRRDGLWIIAHSNCKRIDLRFSDWQERRVQENKDWNLEEIQSEWEELIFNSWSIMQNRDWLKSNFLAYGALDGISDELERCKALGNSIVPQVVFPILKLIKVVDNL